MQTVLWGKRVQRWLGRKIFAEEVRRIDLERNAFIQARADFETYKQSLTVADLVREQLKGFNPRLLDTNAELPEILGEEDSQEEFLAKCKSLSENKALHTIADYLIRNQIAHSVKEAGTLNEINFGRTTINGVELLLEEVDALAAVFDERHVKDPEFDEHEVV